MSRLVSWGCKEVRKGKVHLGQVTATLWNREARCWEETLEWSCWGWCDLIDKVDRWEWRQEMPSTWDCWKGRHCTPLLKRCARCACFRQRCLRPLRSCNFSPWMTFAGMRAGWCLICSVEGMGGGVKGGGLMTLVWMCFQDDVTRACALEDDIFGVCFNYDVAFLFGTWYVCQFKDVGVVWCVCVRACWCCCFVWFVRHIHLTPCFRWT